MHVVTVPAHLATLIVNDAGPTVAVVKELPTEPMRMVHTVNDWWVCDGCYYSLMSPVLNPAPTCPAGCRVPLDLTGQRIGIRAAEDPDWRSAIIPIGASESLRHIVVHPGCIVGSAVVEAVVPIRVDFTYPGEPALIAASPPMLTPQRLRFADGAGSLTTDLTDQLAYQQFTPGKTALILADPAPCEQRCPGCWGSGTTGTLLALCGQVEAYDPDDPCVMRAGHSGPHYHESDVASDWAPAIAEHCPTCLNWSCGTCPPIPFATDETWSVWP